MLIKILKMTKVFSINSWFKLVLPVMVFAFLITSCSKDDDNGGTTDNIVEIADAELRDIVREALNLSSTEDLTESKMAGLITLNINNSVVTNLSGLEKAVNLEVFLARSTEIISMDPITNLTNLKEIDMRDAVLPGANKLAFLSNFNKLEKIDFQNTKGYEDISVLTGKMTLTHINFRETEVRDITPLTGMTQLQFLNLNRAGGGNGIINPELIAPFVNLYYLSLRNTQLGNEKFKMFENFTQLVESNIRNTGITDITPLVRAFEKGAFTQALSEKYNNKLSLDLQGNSITNLCDIKQWVNVFPDGELETAGNFDFGTCPE
jgi:hypothetical protein